MADQTSYLPDPSQVIQTIPIAQPGAAGAGAAAAAEAQPGKAFKILRTLEVDPYSKPLVAVGGAAEPAFAAAAEAAAAATDDFTGHDRKAAKISIAEAEVEQFPDLRALLKSLTPDDTMAEHDPEIPTTEDSDRVDEEQRNVHVDCWLFAAAREKDNDFHTILGSDPAKKTVRFMNAEVSGLPPDDSAAFDTLKAARDSFVAIVQQTPLAGYDFYDPPIPVTVEGSLFFDVTHAHGGATPGPSRAKPKTIWEIHPVTSMTTRDV